MSQVESGFSVPEKLATFVYRGVHTGSGFGGSRERAVRADLKDHLGLRSTTTASPDQTVAGMMLVCYVTASTRLIGMLGGQGPEVIQGQILEYLRVPPGETPQETLERLLNVAMENSQRINPF